MASTLAHSSPLLSGASLACLGPPLVALDRQVRGKGTKLGEGEGSKLGEGERDKVR